MITIVGLGPGDISTLSLGARQALETASEQHSQDIGRLYIRTAKHPSVTALQSQDLHFDTFDRLYETLPDFDAVYSTIAAEVVTAAIVQVNGGPQPVTFAVPGHPLFAEESVRLIRESAAQDDIPVTIVTSASFVEAVLTAAGAGLAEGCDIRDALTLPESDAIDRQGHRLPGRPDTARPLLLYQVYDAHSASRAKLALMQDYPDDWTVLIVRHAGVPGEEEVQKTPLFRLDREPVDHLTSVYVPPLPPELRRHRFPDLVGLMSRLRAPDGCPWDREQTPLTLRRYMIEETYEAIEAIEADDPQLLCEELGDVLLQVVFHAQLASETGDFNIDDVTAGIVRKLVRRHPHVFGDVSVADSDEVLRNWEKIKRDETKDKAERRRDSALDGVPKGLPALMQAMEVSKRAVKVGFEWESLADVLAKLDEEIEELRAELNVAEPNEERVLAELGDLLFTIVQIARWNRLDAEEALRSMVARFEKRFRHMEKRAAETGTQLSTLTPQELDALWVEAKGID